MYIQDREGKQIETNKSLVENFIPTCPFCEWQMTQITTSGADNLARRFACPSCLVVTSYPQVLSSGVIDDRHLTANDIKMLACR